MSSLFTIVTMAGIRYLSVVRYERKWHIERKGGRTGGGQYNKAKAENRRTGRQESNPRLLNCNK